MEELAQSGRLPAMGGIDPGQGIKNSAMATVGASRQWKPATGEAGFASIEPTDIVFSFCLERGREVSPGPLSGADHRRTHGGHGMICLARHPSYMTLMSLACLSADMRRPQLRRTS
jgi:hypothetical protein